MKINQINLPQIGNKSDIKGNKKVPQYGLSQDCFTKSSNVSFGSSSFLDSFLDLLDNITIAATEITQMYEKEIHVEALINVLSKKEYRTILTAEKTKPIEHMMNRLGSFASLSNDFKNAGINTVWQLDNFIKTFTKSPTTKKAFSGQEYEAMQIYGLLARKDDLANYGDLLLYLFNQEDDKENPDYSKLNEYPDFLRQLGINKTADFETKFAHLKTQFNDFQQVSDKVEAIDYVQSTYNAKISHLNELVGKDAAKVYSGICDIVDYFYDKNNGKNLDGLKDIIDVATQANKIKSQSLKLFSPNSSFETVEEKIDLYELLKECDVSVNDFNAIASKSFIEGAENDIFMQLINKKHLTECIAEIKGTKKEEASEFYKKFADVINAIYDDETGNLDSIKTLIDLSKEQNIKDSNGLLRLYQEISGDKKKRTMSSEEVVGFIQLFELPNSKTLIETARKQKVPAIKLLEAEKAKFKAIEQEIEQYISTDKSGFFAGQTALDVYKEYYTSFAKGEENIPTILENIAYLNSSSSEQYQQKLEQLARFEEFFPDRNSLIDFINTNEIDFEEENKTYKENCLSILEAISDTKNPELTQERIDYFANSGFLLKSQSRLSEFLEKMPEKGLRTEVLSLIADKKVPSLNQMEKFFRQYNLSNIDGRALLDFLKNLPKDVGFTQATTILDTLQKEINARNLPLQITAENINAVDIATLKDMKKITTEQIISTLNKANNAQAGTTFLTTMPESKEDKHIRYSAKKIAEEIAFKINVSDESYQNLTRLLGLSKAELGLKEDASEYLHVKAIQEKLPKEFIDFVNANDWLEYTENETGATPGLILHARLRTIDRFALENATNISELYTEETKSKLKELFKTIYTQNPCDIKGTDRTKRIITNHQIGSNIIEAVFSPRGKMITIVQKK